MWKMNYFLKECFSFKKQDDLQRFISVS
jgi:hypothetical protein